MVKVGIVGAGFMGSMHAAVYNKLPDVKIAGICDIRAEKAKSLAEKHKSVAFYDAELILKRDDITVIDICLPTFLHKEFVVKAAKAGKDVICEKPIALTVADADEMVKICKENRVRFMVAQVIRFWPEYQFLKEVHDRKKYGNLISLSCRRLASPPTYGWQNWLMDGKRSGGAPVDLHIHDTDFIRYLMGKEPKTVYGRGIKDPESGYTHIFSTFTFDDGAVVTAEGGWDMPSKFSFLMSYTAQYEKATIDFNCNTNPTLTVYEAAGNIERPVFDVVMAEETGGNISVLGGYFNEIRYFIEHVTHNKPFSVVTPEDARNTLDLVLKEIQSADGGTQIIL